MWTPSKTSKALLHRIWHYLKLQYSKDLRSTLVALQKEWMTCTEPSTIIDVQGLLRIYLLIPKLRLFYIGCIRIALAIEFHSCSTFMWGDEDIDVTSALISWSCMLRAEVPSERSRSLQRVWDGTVNSSVQADQILRAYTPTDRARLITTCSYRSGDLRHTITPVALTLSDDMNRISVACCSDSNCNLARR